MLEEHFSNNQKFLDKSCVSYAALWGMKDDAHLVGAEYSWLTTIFYLGYLFFEFPVGFLFQKCNIARACGIFITLWGVVLLCMTAANDFAGLATARFFLGALESGVSPVSISCTIISLPGGDLSCATPGFTATMFRDRWQSSTSRPLLSSY